MPKTCAVLHCKASGHPLCRVHSRRFYKSPEGRRASNARTSPIHASIRSSALADFVHRVEKEAQVEVEVENTQPKPPEHPVAEFRQEPPESDS